MLRHLLVALPTVALLALPAPAAPPDVPERLSYQGVLLDDLGQPRTGTVDLTLRVWDALVGGTLVYKEVFFSVALTDGVFTVELGPTGAATDTPDDPLTTDLVTALSGDVSGASPVRFLEVTVGTTGALARSQLLTVPYALRAESAAAADTATTAIDATNVGGLSSTFVTQIYAHTNLDDSGPGNDDPQEGLADVDGDGIANFLDPDNDDDGLTDSEEVAQGTDLNLVTPVISGFSPPIPPDGVPFLLTVLGANFDPGQLVTLGGAPLPAQNLTAASSSRRPASTSRSPRSPRATRWSP